MNAADKSLIRDRIKDLKREIHLHPDMKAKNEPIIKHLKSWLVGKPKAEPEKVMTKAEMIAKLKEMTGIDDAQPGAAMVIPDRATVDKLWHWLKTGPNIQIQAPEDVKHYMQAKFKALKASQLNGRN